MRGAANSCESDRPLVHRLWAAVLADRSASDWRHPVTLLDLDSTQQLPDGRVPSRRYLALLDGSSVQGLRSVLAAGADGVVTWRDDIATVTRAAEALGAGRSFISPTSAAMVLESVRRRHDAPHLDAVVFSERENEIIESMFNGMSARAMALQLGISAKTVEAHKSRIFARLGVRSQSQAIAKLSAGRGSTV